MAKSCCDAQKTNGEKIPEIYRLQLYVIKDNCQLILQLQFMADMKLCQQSADHLPVFLSDKFPLAFLKV
jgi:hypothetical protein